MTKALTKTTNCTFRAKKWRGTSKKNFRYFAPDRCRPHTFAPDRCPHHFQIRSGATGSNSGGAQSSSAFKFLSVAYARRCFRKGDDELSRSEDQQEEDFGQVPQFKSRVQRGNDVRCSTTYRRGSLAHCQRVSSQQVDTGYLLIVRSSRDFQEATR